MLMRNIPADAKPVAGSERCRVWSRDSTGSNISSPDVGAGVGAGVGERDDGQEILAGLGVGLGGGLGEPYGTPRRADTALMHMDTTDVEMFLGAGAGAGMGVGRYGYCDDGHGAATTPRGTHSALGLGLASHATPFASHSIPQGEDLDFLTSIQASTTKRRFGAGFWGFGG